MEENSRKSANEVSISEYLDVLRRRKGILIQTFVIVFVLGAIVTFLAKPVYRANARILVEGKSLTVAQYNGADPLSNLFLPDTGHDVTTQIEVLQGQKVVGEAYKAAGVPPGTVKLDVKQLGTTDIIDLTTESTNAGYAEQLARTLPDTYQQYFTGNRKMEVTNALTFARNRMDDENRKLSNAQKQLQEIQRVSRIYSVENERKSRIDESSTADAALQKAKTDINSQKTRLASLMNERSKLSAVEETPTETTNAQVEATKGAIEQLMNQRVSLLILYKPTSTNVQEVDAQINYLKARLAKMPVVITTVTRTHNPAVAALNDKISQARVELAASKAEYASSKARADRSDSRLLSFGNAERLQEQAEADVEHHKSSVALLTKSVEDLSLRDKATHDPVTTISAAGKAIQIAPKKMDNLIKAAFIGLLLGFGLALLQEYLDDRINAVEDAQRVLKVPSLGYIPLIESEDSRLLLHSRQRGSVLESYRVVRANVQFASIDTPTSSLLITSTMPSEGKSITASNLAVALALDERRVILVDADLRRPTIHRKFEIASQPGLTNVLLGQIALDDALRDTEVAGLKVLTAGTTPPNPAEMLNSEAMRQLHIELKSRADIVIFDSPPMLSAADAQVLSAEIDGIIYVVQFGETKKSALRHAAELMKQSRARVLGIVFNKIIVGGRDNPYYYGYYHGYHTAPGEDAPLVGEPTKTAIPSNGAAPAGPDSNKTPIAASRRKKGKND